MPVTVPAFSDAFDKRTFERFCREVWIQADYGLYAWKDIVEGQGWGGETARVFPGLHSMLSAAGNISKIFDPVPGAGPRAAARGARMLQAFGETLATIPTIVDRELRDSLEHFDERLDDVENGERAGLVYWSDHNIGRWEIASHPNTEIPIRHLDNTVWKYHTLKRRSSASTSLKLEDLAAELTRLHESAGELINLLVGQNLPPLPPRPRQAQRRR
jgi:hypothetical protein